MLVQARKTHRDLPPTAELLTEGGDGRIHSNLDGVNRYGCSAYPEPGLLSFGSSTASTISAHGFAAAEMLRNRLIYSGKRERAEVTYRREMDRMRGELTSLFGLRDVTGLRIIFGASGTDLHLFISQLMVDENAEKPLIVCIDSEETGRGVPSALAGQHFSDLTALGRCVPAHSPLDCGRPIDVLKLKCRRANGNVRPLGELDAEVEQLVTRAVNSGRRVLIALADLSKTGLILPGIDCVLGLKKRFPQAVEVLVDGCQARLQGSTIRAYLAHDFMVAITGSKFLSGPTFSGALLVRANLSTRFKHTVLPNALRHYSARADWPSDWEACLTLDDVPNFGLLLRWEAALAELRAFAQLAEADVARFVRAFGCAIKGYFDRQDLLELVPVPDLDRGAIAPNADGWDHLQTIFSFLIRRRRNGKLEWLNRAETKRVQEMLLKKCQVGQPVACGERSGVEVSALRLCLSSKLIVEALAPGGRGSEAVIADAIAVLDKVRAVGDLLEDRKLNSES